MATTFKRMRSTLDLYYSKVYGKWSWQSSMPVWGKSLAGSSNGAHLVHGTFVKMIGL